MSSIILIGMPSSGKSTIGVLLAKALGMGFVDTDILIQRREGKMLHQILQHQGYLKLRDIEEQVLLESAFKETVIATGGSAVYSEAGMQSLKQYGRIVYLKVSVETIKSRVGDLLQRGVAVAPEMSVDDIALEREPLYERYADITIDTEQLNVNQTLQCVLDNLIR